MTGHVVRTSQRRRVLGINNKNQPIMKSLLSNTTVLGKKGRVVDYAKP